MPLKYTPYYEKNISVIPEQNGIPLKGVSFSKWYNQNYRPSAEELTKWEALKGFGVGLLTGLPSGVVALDIDHATPEQQEGIIKRVGKSPCGKIGEKGITYFYKYNNDENVAWERGGVVLCELLATGRKTTIPPSLHRKTKKAYQWEGKPLLESLDLLPLLPDNIKEILDKYLLISRKSEPTFTYSASFDTPELQDAEALLEWCSPDCDRTEWISIGSCLRSCFGDAAFQLWDSWSAKSKKYNKKDARASWRSFQGYYNYGVIVNVAKKQGYTPPKKEEKNTITIAVEDWDKKRLEVIAEQIKESQQLPDFYLNAPKHIKEICDWILDTSFYPQPIITVGGVMAFLSFLMGTNAELGGLKPNLYVVCLAGTGTGKDHIVNCIRGMADCVGLKDKISSAWTSDTAIVKRLKKNNGKTLYLTDEMYAVMQSISRGNSNSREAAAATILLKAYSGVQVETVDYADEKEKPTVVVSEPFISIAGFSTPEPFFDAIGSKEAFNGFIGRLAVFEGSFLLPEPNEKNNKNAWKNIPPYIKATLTEIKENVKKLEFEGQKLIATKSIQYGEGVLETIQQMEKDIRDKRNIFKLEGNPMDNVIARMGELTKKYAIIASKGDTIEMSHLTWAKSLAEYNLGIICGASAEFTDSKFNSKVNKLFNWIEKQNSASRTHLNNSCKWFDNRREREDAIQELIDQEKIEVVNLDSAGSKKKVGYRVVKV